MPSDCREPNLVSAYAALQTHMQAVGADLGRLPDNSTLCGNGGGLVSELYALALDILWEYKPAIVEGCAQDPGAPPECLMRAQDDDPSDYLRALDGWITDFRTSGITLVTMPNPSVTGTKSVNLPKYATYKVIYIDGGARPTGQAKPIFLRYTVFFGSSGYIMGWWIWDNARLSFQPFGYALDPWLNNTVQDLERQQFRASYIITDSRVQFNWLYNRTQYTCAGTCARYAAILCESIPNQPPSQIFCDTLWVSVGDEGWLSDPLWPIVDYRAPSGFRQIPTSLLDPIVTLLWNAANFATSYNVYLGYVGGILPFWGSTNATHLLLLGGGRSHAELNRWYQVRVDSVAADGTTTAGSTCKFMLIYSPTGEDPGPAPLPPGLKCSYAVYITNWYWGAKICSHPPPCPPLDLQYWVAGNASFREDTVTITAVLGNWLVALQHYVEPPAFSEPIIFYKRTGDSPVGEYFCYSGNCGLIHVSVCDV